MAFCSHFSHASTFSLPGQSASNGHSLPQQDTWQNIDKRFASSSSFKERIYSAFVILLPHLQKSFLGCPHRRMVHFALPEQSARGQLRQIATSSSGSQKLIFFTVWVFRGALPLHGRATVSQRYEVPSCPATDLITLLAPPHSVFPKITASSALSKFWS